MFNNRRFESLIDMLQVCEISRQGKIVIASDKPSNNGKNTRYAIKKTAMRLKAFMNKREEEFA